MVLKLVDDVNEKNYYDIIIFLQKNKFDSNNYMLDEIIKEEDENKKAELIDKMNSNITIDTQTSGYVAQLFSIFKNNIYFCIKEKKYSECIICGQKNSEVVKESKPFIYVNINNILLKKIFNVLLEEYKEKFTYDCPCRKNENEDLLCNRVKYTIENYPNFLNILFDMSFRELEQYKQNIFQMTEEYIVLNINKKYKLRGIISVPYINHYICIIFNPRGILVNQYFKSNLIYYHDGNENGGELREIRSNEDWKKLGIPYILVYELYPN